MKFKRDSNPAWLPDWVKNWYPLNEIQLDPFVSLFVSDYTSTKNYPVVSNGWSYVLSLFVLLLVIARTKKQPFWSHFFTIVNTRAKAILKINKQTKYQPTVLSTYNCGRLLSMVKNGISCKWVSSFVGSGMKIPGLGGHRSLGKPTLCWLHSLCRFGSFQPQEVLAITTRWFRIQL